MLLILNDFITAVYLRHVQEKPVLMTRTWDKHVGTAVTNKKHQTCTFFGIITQSSSYIALEHLLWQLAFLVEQSSF